ncbi:MAG: polyphosphate kinase 1 [Bacteroidota bacterium]
MTEKTAEKQEKNLFFDRDLSWLSFNFRVLLEARDESLPLYERIKFLAIYASNLDEFFRVRVAGIRSVKDVKKKNRADLGYKPKAVLATIHEEVNRQQYVFDDTFNQQILPALQKNRIHLLQGPPTDAEHQEFLSQFFDDELCPYIHPELLRRKRIKHFLRENALYLVVKLFSNSPRAFREAEETGNQERRARRALILIPTHYFPRFIKLPSQNGEHYIMFLDDVIRFNLTKIFPGYEVITSHTIKLNRDADLLIEDEFHGDLVEKIRKSLRKRQTGAPARFLFDASMPKSLLRYLRDTFTLDKEDVVAGGKYHNFHEFFGFPNPVAPALEAPALPPMPNAELDAYPDMFKAIQKKSWILHFPYQSYDSVIRFLSRAASDPQVKSIQTTQYRVASNSAIVSNLIRAAQNGKEVTVFVELKARFDEDSNLRSAQEMQRAGVNIIYSYPNLKVHAKVALVNREEQGKIKGYAFLSTGNFNEKTARLYADHGYFTAEKDIINELRELFKRLKDPNYVPPPFKQLLVAQYNIRPDFKKLIEKEMAHAQQGKPAKILIKLNNLQDEEMIRHLYRASQAGVQVDLIIRGICCLRPGMKGPSENIRIIRIVDQFLEHARVFVFHNLGDEVVLMGSADWMTRNLSRRIEVIFPVREKALKDEVMAILELQWQDNVKAVELSKDLENIPIEPHPSATRIRSQNEIYRRIKEGKLIRTPLAVGKN